MWHVYYDGAQYKLTNDEKSIDVDRIVIATFRVFDMAYQYVTGLNGNHTNNAYSRWTSRK